jgi:tellurite resistance protein/DNA-binding PadR family transcriptional regulator
MDYRNFREDFEVPFEVTQKGISHAIKIQQKHLPRALKKLISDNFLEEKMTHVKDVKQKRKVYFLTEEGIRYAWELINNLKTKEIPIVTKFDDGKATKEPQEIQILGDLYNRDKPEISLIDLLLFLDNTGFYNKDALKNEVNQQTIAKVKNEGVVGKNSKEPEPQLSDQPPQELEKHLETPVGTSKISSSEKREIYFTALKQAWQDGQITKDERDILTELQEKLGISAEEHKKIEIEIMSAQNGTKPESEEIYKAALKHAWIDGVISEDEDSLLRVLRRTLKISDEQHKIFEKELKLNKRAR